MTPVDRVPAFITAFRGPGSYGPGRVDVDVSAGSCLVTVGRSYASLDRQGVLDVAHPLQAAARLLEAGEADGPAVAHLREMVDGLGLDLRWLA